MQVAGVHIYSMKLCGVIALTFYLFGCQGEQAGRPDLTGQANWVIADTITLYEHDKKRNYRQLKIKVHLLNRGLADNSSVKLLLWWTSAKELPALVNYPAHYQTFDLSEISTGQKRLEQVLELSGLDKTETDRNIEMVLLSNNRISDHYLEYVLQK